MFEQVYDFFLKPRARHPAQWEPAYVAMQLGFVAGGFGLVGRDLLIMVTVDRWLPIVTTEIAFAFIIGVGFPLHTIGFAASGVILACLAGVVRGQS